MMLKSSKLLCIGRDKINMDHHILKNMDYLVEVFG